MRKEDLATILESFGPAAFSYACVPDEGCSGAVELVWVSSEFRRRFLDGEGVASAGSRWMGMVHEADRGDVRAWHLSLPRADGGEQYYRLRECGGGYVWVREACVSCGWGTGQEEHVLLGHPIASGAVAEACAARGEDAVLREALEKVAEVAELPLLCWEPETRRVCAVSSSARSLLGYGRDERIDLDLLESFEGLEIRKKRSQAVLRGARANFDAIYRASDGTSRHVRVRTRRLDACPARVMGVLEPITRESETAHERGLTAAAVEALPVPVVWFDSEARIRFANQAAAGVLDYEAERLLRLTGRDLSTDLPRAVWRGLWENLEAHGRLTFEATCERGDGVQRPIEFDGVYLEVDQRAYFCAHLRDLTRRKETLGQLQLRTTILDQISDYVVAMDLDGHILYVNKAVTTMLNVERGALVGEHPRILGDRVVEGADLDSIVSATVATGAWQGEVLFEVSPTNRRWLDVRSWLARDESDEAFGIISCATDVTERKRAAEALRESEQKFRALFDRAIDAHMVFDKGRYTDCNAMALELLGMRERAELLSKHPVDFSPLYQPDGQRSAAKAQGIIQACYREGHQHFEWLCRREDGQELLIDVLLNLVPLHGRHVIHAICRDITRQRRMEEELRQSQKMEAVGQLASGIAHDMDNAFTAILGGLSLAEKALSARHPARKHLRAVAEAANDAAGVTRSLLMFGGRATPQPRPIQLRSAVTRVLRLMRHLLPAVIHLEEQLRDDPEAWVNADMTQLQQVVMNLLINARDAMPEGGTIRIVVDRTRNATGDERALLEFRDDGEGMTAEVRARALDPFFTTKPRGRGTGLGLAIVHGIVEAHGGEMELDSEPGLGTRARILLPLSEPDAGGASAGAPAAIPAGQREVVLVAEDNRHVRGVIVTSLRELNYDVLSVGDGVAFREAAKKHRRALRLLVVDVDLPKHDGLSVLRELRADGLDTPAIVITAKRERGLEAADADGYVRLQKPFRLTELSQLASDMLRRNGTQGDG